MRGVNKHLEGIYSIWFQGTVENEESSKSEAALDIITSKFVKLYTGQVSGTPAQSPFHAPLQ